MKTLLISLLCFTAFSASNKQSWMSGIDFLQPVELSVQLFGQLWDTATEGLETQLLQQLYPGQASTIQAQLDACESAQITNYTTQLQRINADLFALVNACSAPDPTAPFNQLFQDTLQSMAVIAAPCPGLSVNLVGDIENLLATAIAQGAQFLGPWFAPFAQFNSIAFAPFQTFSSGFGQYLAPVGNLTDSTLEMLGVTPATAQQTDADTTAAIGAFTTLLTDTTASGTPNTTDIVNAINTELAVANDYGAEFTQILQASNQYLEQPLQAICSFIGPMSSFAQFPQGFMGFQN